MSCVTSRISFLADVVSPGRHKRVFLHALVDVLERHDAVVVVVVYVRYTGGTCMVEQQVAMQTVAGA